MRNRYSSIIVVLLLFSTEHFFLEFVNLLSSSYFLQTLFKAMDTNEDELISLADFQYGLLYHHLCSGPDSIFSLWFGKVADEDQID